ncbi:MAG: alpha/beta hydrolase [Propionibacteriaceae bacterium]|jgi:pimeloyl-ACP methyl ester carboxylesterase|nr:alpha/beta hydrolase [Propionibacteriaceae bacterium]
MPVAVDPKRAAFIAGLHAYYAVLGKFAPKLAVKSAVYWWLRLPQNKGRRKDNRPSPGEITKLPFDDKRNLVVESWGEGPIVYLVHGWGGWRGQVCSFVEPLVGAGLRVIAFDSLSHGDSDPGEYGPKHSTGGEMVASFKKVIAHFGPAHAVIGHSLGCASATRTLYEGAVSERLCLVSPSPDMSKLGKLFCDQIGLPERLFPDFLAENERWAHRSMDDFIIADMAGAPNLPPAHIWHDTKDKEVPHRVAEKIHANWPGSTLIETVGLGHHRILIDPEVVEQVTTAAIG